MDAEREWDLREESQFCLGGGCVGRGHETKSREGYGHLSKLISLPTIGFSQPSVKRTFTRQRKTPKMSH